MRKTNLERIVDAEKEMQELEKRIKKLRHAHKEDERKARMHRICERGGHLEGILPDTEKLTFEQFKIFLEKTLRTPSADKILKELLPPEPAKEPEGENAVTEPAEAEPAPQPAVLEVQANSESTATKPIKAVTPTGGADKSKTVVTEAKLAG